MSQDKNNSASRDEQLKQTLKALIKARARLESLEAERHEPIAVVGMGCRLPGADNADAYWRLLEHGGSGISEAPAERWDLDKIYDPEGRPGKLSTRCGGFCNQDLSTFDAAFFGIAPREAEQIDAQQRLFLEVAWEALDDAGLIVPELAGSKSGIFLGIASSDQQWLELTRPTSIDLYTGTGTAASVSAGRLAYLFDWRGPAMAIDTACSSSLVAVHLACRSLRSGESDLALAGGVYTMTSPLFALALDKLGLLAPDGRCRPFDAAAGGTVASEGCGVLVLKRLDDARRAGDRILAVIRGSAVNQDGRSAGLTAPNLPAQEAVIRAALADARLDAAAISHVEAHGTGTALGDPVEVEALDAVYGRPEDGAGACVLGAAKANIGHTMPAAGVAGLIKLILSLRHQTIPPVAGFKRLNPHITLGESRLEVAAEARPWPAEGEPRRAAISSFGWSGTNAHVVIEEAPREVPETAAETPETSDGEAAERPYLLTLSARSPEARQAMVERYHEFLAADPPISLADLCYTANRRRTHHEYRLAVVGSSKEEMVKRLSSRRPCNGRAECRRPATRPSKLAFVFSGQGSQWVGMGLQLALCEPVFRAALERCDRAFRQLAEGSSAPWSLLEELEVADEDSRLDQTEIAQPAIFAIQVALAELWKSWGVSPQAVVGHSVGEIAAAHVAGALSFDDAVLLAYHRGRLMQRATGQGRMVSVQLSAEQAQERLQDRPEVSIAAINAPRSVVLAGPADEVEKLIGELEADGVELQRMRVDYAFHSPQMEPVQDELRRQLAALSPRRARLPLYSTVTGGRVEGTELSAGYWSRGIRETVRFAAAVEALIADEFDVFLEVAPHRVLAAALKSSLDERQKEGAVLASMRRWRDEPATILEAAGALHVHGYEIDFSQLQPAGEPISLPPYPWQRRLCRRQGVAAVPSWQGEVGTHPLLGLHLPQAEPAGRHLWHNAWSLHQLRYLADHRVEGAVVVPGSAWAEMATAALTMADETLELADLEIERPLVIGEGAAFEIQTVLEPGDGLQPPGLQIFSRAQDDPDAEWRLHAVASVRPGAADGRREGGEPAALIAALGAGEGLAGQDFYRRLATWGLEYGPAFCAIDRIWRGGDVSAAGTAVGELVVPDEVASQLVGYRLHPAVLDACFQVAGALVFDRYPAGEGRPYMPVRLGRLRVLGACPDRLWCRVEQRASARDGGTIEVDIDLIDASGRVFAAIDGLVLERLEDEAAAGREDLYDLRLVAAPAPEAEPGWDEQGGWLVLADRGEVCTALRERLRLAGERCVVARLGEHFERRGDELVVRATPEDLRRAHAALRETGLRWRGVIYGWSLDAEAGSEHDGETFLTQVVEPTCVGLLHLLHTVADHTSGQPPAFFLLTRGAQQIEGETPSIAQALTLGLARTLANEHPEIRCRRIDLPAGDAGCAIDLLWREIRLDDRENEVALRPGVDAERFALRLEHGGEEPPPTAAAGRPFRLATRGAGVIDELCFTPFSRRPPAAGEVEIEIVASGLNFSDVMKAMALYPGLPAGPVPFGIECAGRISAVGDGVEDLAPGDEVIAFGFFTLASHVTVPAALAVRKPSQLTFAEAATVPVAFGTAYHALHQLGRIGAGEKVLIHSATGGVGQAAIQLARLAGAEIFATAGSEEKRALLREQGIEQVMDSRSLDFADQVMAATGGRGVDLVLNSLSGEALSRGLSVLAPGGRFLEIGKRDIHGNGKLGLLPFKNYLSFFAIDLDGLCRRRPQQVGELLRRLVPLFEEGKLEPLAHRVFPAARAKDAFRLMARAQHVGKLVIAFEDPAVELAPASEVHFDPQASYLLTGGLGGLGLKVARWMVEQGARRLILLGRSAPDAAARAVLDELEAAGARVQAVEADVARYQALAPALDEATSGSAPLRGIVHAAGVLRDALLAEQSEELFLEVLRPKVAGAWNLHRYAEERRLELDFFALFSSISALVGTPGQANYAAGNAFLDALARYRRSRRQSAISINWGPWAEVGMAAGQRLAASELRPIAPRDGVAHLGRLLASGEAQKVVVQLRAGTWPRFVTASPIGARLTVEDAAGGAGDDREALIAALRDGENGDRREPLETYLRQEIGRALQRPAEEIDVHQPLVNLGLDSLMAVELKNRIVEVVDVNLPMSRLLLAPSLVALADQLLAQLAPAGETPADRPQPVLQPAVAASGGEAWEEITL